MINTSSLFVVEEHRRLIKKKDEMIMKKLVLYMIF